MTISVKINFLTLVVTLSLQANKVMVQNMLMRGDHNSVICININRKSFRGDIGNH